MRLPPAPARVPVIFIEPPRLPFTPASVDTSIVIVPLTNENDWLPGFRMIEPMNSPAPVPTLYVPAAGRSPSRPRFTTNVGAEIGPVEITRPIAGDPPLDVIA